MIRLRARLTGFYSQALLAEIILLRDHRARLFCTAARLHKAGREPQRHAICNGNPVVAGKGVRRINLSKPKIRFGGIENGHEILVPVRRVHIIKTRLKRLNRWMAERPYRPYGPLKNESAIYAERRNRNARIARLALRRIRSNPAQLISGQMRLQRWNQEITRRAQ